MGRGEAPALLPRSAWKAPSILLLMTFLLCPSRITTNDCPFFCTCDVMMNFYHVKCEKASLREVPTQFPSKTTTTLLNLDWNRIKILRENALNGFNQLQVLNLEHNQLEEIDEKSFLHCPELRFLQLAHNNLKTLNSEMFLKNKVLLFIDLSHNRLILPGKGPFLKSNSVMFLNLSHTSLSEVPVDTFTEMRGLHQLELNNNYLKTVSVDALSVFTNKNVTVSVGENPLHCDCELKKTWSWVTEHAASAAPRDPPKCVTPKAMKDKPWFDLRTLGCGGSAAGVYALYAIAGLLVLIAVLVGLVIWAVRRRRRSRAAVKGGLPQRPKHRLAPPVGEYIEVIEDTKSPSGIRKEHLGLAPMRPEYDTLSDPDKNPKAVDPSDRNLSRSPEDKLRYVPTISRSTYVLPMPPQNDGPIYVNMKGPPLPQRWQTDVPPPPSEPAPPVALAPSTHPVPAPVPAPTPAPRTLTAPLPAQGRPCSIPLLEGCDFYEVVD